MARCYHKRKYLTNETYVGQLKNIMGPVVEILVKIKHGQRVPPDLQNDNSRWVKLFVCFDEIVEFSTRNITLRFGTFKIGNIIHMWLEVAIRE